MLASVKVMRSHDYCHFEVQLSAECADLDAVNDLRKEAAILVDEAVRQYKIAKNKESSRGYNEPRYSSLLERAKEIEAKPKNERTPEEAAILRGLADHQFAKEFHEDDYYYCDPEREHHFSMLRKFKDVTIRAGTVTPSEGENADGP